MAYIDSDDYQLTVAYKLTKEGHCTGSADHSNCTEDEYEVFVHMNNIDTMSAVKNLCESGQRMLDDDKFPGTITVLPPALANKIAQVLTGDMRRGQSQHNTKVQLGTSVPNPFGQPARSKGGK